jgi:hypothetical protein
MYMMMMHVCCILTVTNVAADRFLTALAWRSRQYGLARHFLAGWLAGWLLFSYKMQFPIDALHSLMAMVTVDLASSAPAPSMGFTCSTYTT